MPDTLFDLLKNYIEVYGRPKPIKYDILQFSEEHRKFDALIRRYWDALHPLSRDLFTSFANEFQYLLHKLDEAEGKVSQIEGEMEQFREKYQVKVDELEDQFENEVLERVSQLKSKTFDEISIENKDLHVKLQELNQKLTEQKELNTTLRQEINLLIDESDYQEHSKNTLEKSVSDSLVNFKQFTSQLDSLEAEIKKYEERDQKNRDLIQRLRKEFEETESLALRKNASWEKKYEDLQSRHDQLRSKIKQLSPEIQKINSQLDGLTRENATLKAENADLKTLLYNESDRIETVEEIISPIENLIKSVDEDIEPGPSIKELNQEIVNEDKQKYDKFLQKESSLKDSMLKSMKQVQETREMNKPKFQKKKTVDEFPSPPQNSPKKQSNSKKNEEKQLG